MFALVQCTTSPVNSPQTWALSALGLPASRSWNWGLTRKTSSVISPEGQTGACVKPIHLFFFIDTQVSKMAQGKFPFCLRGSLSPGMNKLLLCRKNKPTNNSFSYYYLHFQNKDNFHGDMALSILRVTVLQTKSQAFETRLFSQKLRSDLLWAIPYNPSWVREKASITHC